MAVRQLLWERRDAALALAFPAALRAAALEVAEQLPEIHAAAVRLDGKLIAYLPADPGDAYIEGLRQALSRRLPLFFLEGNRRLRKPLRYLLPDAALLPELGSAAYQSLARQALQGLPEVAADAEARAREILVARRGAPAPLLLLCDFPAFFALEKLCAAGRAENAGAEEPPDEEDQVDAEVWPVKPEHLYFALGELPHYAGEMEKERQNPWMTPRPYFDLVKSLFIATRAALRKDRIEAAVATVKQVQTALTFTRNLAAVQGRLTPGLLDLVAAAKGVFGHGFAAKLFESARRYPFVPSTSEGWLEIGRDTVRVPGGEAQPAFNLLEHSPKIWKTLRLQRDPDPERKQRYRYLWDARGMCSHVPEDIRIERFNRTARARSREMLFHGESRSEPLTASLKDGVDARETLRQLAGSGRIHVREAPPVRGRVDTVVAIFDPDHDARYPFRMAWTYEHAEESMLTFFGTDPWDDMVGPGIARAEFGGFSLLFPPRPVPDVFKLPAEEFGFQNLAEQLVYGALRHSAQRAVAYVSHEKPGLRLRQMAAGFRKRLVWIPAGAFGAETLRRLRRFHVLNGRRVRAWATRFIPE